MKKIILFFIFLIVGILINLLPIEKSFLPFIGNADANRYIEMSKSLDSNPAAELGFFGFILGALNWFSLPLLINLIDIENGYWKMMIINAIILYLIVVQIDKLAKETKLSSTIFITLCLLFMPFLWCWIFIPSKENITVLGFLILFNNYRKDKKDWSFFLAVICGFFKTQIIASIFSFEALKRVKKYYFLLSLLVVNICSILIYKYYEQALSVELYLDNQDVEVNTAGIILFTEQLIKIPVVGVLGVLIRLILFLPAGVAAVKSLSGSFESFLMNYSSVIVGLLSWIFIFHIKRTNPKEKLILWSFLIVFLFIPFIQFRYFWWTIPLFLYFIARKSNDDIVIMSQEVKRMPWSDKAVHRKEVKQV